MPEHPLAETIRGVAADLAEAPLEAPEIERLAPGLASLLAMLRALDALELAEVEPAFTDA